MTVKYSKILAVTGAVNYEPDTILVKYIEGKGFQGVSVETIEGEYNSAEEFNRAVNRSFEVLKKGVDAVKPFMNPHSRVDDVKLYSSLLLSTHDARQFADSLIAALETSEDS